MPRYNRILSLPGFSIKKVSGYQPLSIELIYTRKPRCPHCNSRKVRKKDNFTRTVRHEAIGHRIMILTFNALKLYCHHCKRYGNQQFPGIAKHARSTQRLQSQIFHQHTAGISQKMLAKNFKLGKATIERWYQRFYEKENRELSSYECPTVLGIDEHSFSKKQGYATTLCDLRKHRIFDITKGRAGAELNDYLTKLQGKERVKVVCMDLSTTYRSIVRKHFPNAKIVADRFHVIRLMQHQCMMTYRELSKDIKYNRGVLAALRTNPSKLTERRRLLRDNFLNENPAIKLIYEFQQQLYKLLMKKSRTKDQCQKLIPSFLDMMTSLKNSPFKQLASLGKTLYQWREEVVRMWRFTKSNGITEGFHRKMKLIQRQAYGFRNFENYRTRVRVL